MLLSTRPGIQAVFTAVRKFTNLAELLWDFHYDVSLHLPTHADSENVSLSMSNRGLCTGMV